MELVGVINQPWDGAGSRVGDRLTEIFESGKYERAFISVAWTRKSGTSRIAAAVETFRTAGSELRVVTGVDLGRTSKDGLESLLDLADEAYVFHNTAPSSTFHPKMYLFESSSSAEALIGSANLTAGGLFLNCEANLHVALDLGNPVDVAALDHLRSIYEQPRDAGLPLTVDLIKELDTRGLLSDETRPVPKVPASGGSGGPTLPPIFPSIPVPAPPAIPSAAATPVATTLAPTAPAPTISTFLMRLGPFDAIKQSGHSPDILIPIAARDANPGFWDWPASFPVGSSGYPERYVDLRIINPPQPPVIVRARNYWYEGKHEFRLNCGAIQEAGSPGAIIQVERKAPGTSWDYDVVVIPPSDPTYNSVLAQCTNSVTNSTKRWGYA